jgi:hypothetical protein
MTEFKLDTSGEVRGGFLGLTAISWSDLDAFTQGYVEAMLDGIRYERTSAGVNKGDHYRKWDERVNCVRSRLLAFRDLAPETLARIMKECASYRASRLGRAMNTEAGAKFWAQRQAGGLDRYVPLTPYLGDDGKVYLRED